MNESQKEEPEVKQKTKAFLNWIIASPTAHVILWAIGLNVIMECLCRRTPLGVFLALRNPVMFLLGCGILVLTLAPALFFRRRVFFLTLVSLFWLGLSIADCIVTGYRNSPISAIDLALIPSAFSMLPRYFKPWEIALIGTGLAGALVGLGILFWKTRKRKVNAPHAAYTMLGAIGVVTALMVTVRATGLVPRNFPNLADAYRDYGFAYCFSCSALDRGISRPWDYSEQRMSQIITELESDRLDGALDMDPNIIFVQLESLFDPTRVEGIEYSQDPMPNLRALRSRYPSGYLTVSSVGAGTANTEFEVMTGMSLDYFGPGEYPYETVLQDRTCESMAYNLKKLGYTTHAIHDNTATFYDRNKVFPNLGFDSFTSLEYMQFTSFNPIGWCDDSVLTSQIIDALASSAGPDYIYAISVQGHGKYPRDELEYEHHVLVKGAAEDFKIPYEYYVNQVYEMDTFVMELIRALETYKEPTILVLYGDHLPNFEFLYDRLNDGSCFQTEYAIWSNFPLKAQDLDLNAYQLSAYVQELAGDSEGLLTRLHQGRDDYTDEEYQSRLELMEYDMLYSDPVLEPTQMKMGVKPITVTEAVPLGENLALVGENFTEFSRICVNGRPKETRLVSSTVLLAEDAGAQSGMTVTVEQTDPNGTVLSTSEGFVIN